MNRETFSEDALMNLFEQWREVIDSEPFTEWDPNLVAGENRG